MSKKRPKPVVNDLRFNVAQLLKETTGASRIYTINSSITNPTDADVIFVSPVVGPVKFLRTGADILTTGSLTTNIQKNCGRCLTPFTTSLAIELEEQFYPTIDINTGAVLPLPADEDEANRIDEHHTLDLTSVALQGFLLESEGARYCRTDCQGLCPHCGRDRNNEFCDCEDKAIDSRWASLLALQLED